MSYIDIIINNCNSNYVNITVSHRTILINSTEYVNMSFDLKALHRHHGVGQHTPPADPHLALQSTTDSRFRMAPLAAPAVPQKAARWHHHCFQFHPSAPPSFSPSCYSTSRDSIFHFSIHSLSLYYMPGTVYSRTEQSPCL